MSDEGWGKKSVFGVVIVQLSALIAVIAGLLILPPVEAQGAAEVQYQTRIQDCSVITTQVNAAAAGKATAEGTNAAASVANELGVPVSIIQNCIQAEGDAGDPDDGSSDDVDSKNQQQTQNCAVVINQYNSAVAGDAVASGEDAISEVAKNINAPINVVQNCIQAGGNVAPDNEAGTSGDGMGEGSTDGDDSEEANGDDDMDENVAARESNVIAGTFSDKTLANTGGETVGFVETSRSSAVMIPAGALLVVSSLAGMVWVLRRPDGQG